jgi:Arc/MetJ-type ribon-helix-helix transcriptional regulator
LAFAGSGIGRLPTSEGSVGSIVEAKISERLDHPIDALVEKGWFPSRERVLPEAIRRFLEAQRPEVMEPFLREDVEWGLRGRS